MKLSNVLFLEDMETKQKHNQDKRRAEYFITFDSDFNRRPKTDHKINE